MNNYKIINGLNTILTRHYDAERGYKRAADNCDDADLKAWFMRMSQLRNQFGHEIKKEIRTLGGEPDKGMSLKGKLHQEWMDLKVILSDENDERVLNECIRGEESSIEDFNEVMEMDHMPSDTKKLLSKQKSEIQDALRNIKVAEEVS